MNKRSRLRGIEYLIHKASCVTKSILHDTRYAHNYAGALRDTWHPPWLKGMAIRKVSGLVGGGMGGIPKLHNLFGSNLMYSNFLKVRCHVFFVLLLMGSSIQKEYN